MSMLRPTQTPSTFGDLHVPNKFILLKKTLIVKIIYVSLFQNRLLLNHLNLEISPYSSGLSIKTAKSLLSITYQIHLSEKGKQTESTSHFPRMFLRPVELIRRSKNRGEGNQFFDRTKMTQLKDVPQSKIANRTT